MTKKKSLLFRLGLLVLTLVIAIAIAGCPPADDGEDPQTDQQQQPQDQAQVNLDLAALINDWDQSGHASINDYPAGRDGCILCHDGYAYAQEVEELENIPDGRKVTVDDTTVAVTPTDCQACHTGQGQQLMEEGTVSIPTMENIDAGRSAMCLSCHNPRRAPDINDDRRSAPHSSAQSDVFYGSGGIRAEEFDLGNNPHGNIQDPCISCHMVETDNGMNHTFTVGDEFVEQACGQCHQGTTTTNIEARGDYDGSGEAQGFQDEIEGLLEVLRGAIEEEVGGTFGTGGGQVQFQDANGEDMDPADISNEVYLAAYNWVLVNYDGSRGIHNPTFAVQILQESYREITGEDVPNADTK